MACHNHGRREQTLEDILTPEELAAMRARLDAWVAQFIAQEEARPCICGDAWPSVYHGIYRCHRCLALYRIRGFCCAPSLS